MQNKETAQPVSISAGLVNNGRTSRITTLKPVMKKKEKTQHLKNHVGLDTNTGTSSIVPTTMHSMQKKKAIRLPNESGSSAKKIETTSRSPTMKLFMKKEKIQPSKGSAGVASKSRTRRTLPSRLVTQRKDTTFDNQRQKHHICKDHIVWEGFDDCIVPLEKSCHNPAEKVRLTIAEEKIRDPPCIICATLTRRHQSDKIKMNKDSTPIVKKSGINSTSVSRLSKKENKIQSPPGCHKFVQEERNWYNYGIKAAHTE
ncbi:hypothetical protein GQ457_12G024890 [Hibiscus cannabinus]